MTGALVLLAALASPHPTIQVTPGGDGVAVEGLPTDVIARISRENLTQQEWTEVFSVRVFSETRDAPAMWGSYTASDDALLFRPRFGLQPGVSYAVSFVPARLPGRLGDGLEPISDRIDVPSRAIPASTVVDAVYPSGKSLPENLLRFYVHFSAPMRRGTGYRFVHLRTEEGRDVDLPFLELDQELWDPDGRRLTLLLDPGRIKRGLVPHEDVGAPLVAGQRYTLVIDRDWRDARGAMLAQSHAKSFTATTADRESPQPDHWQIAPPTVGSSAPLRVVLGEPLDHALLHRLIWIEMQGGAALGEIRVSEGESVWEFIPKDAWRDAPYLLRVGLALEDRAGNSVGRPFEVMNAPVGEPAREPVALPFQPRSPDANPNPAER